MATLASGALVATFGASQAAGAIDALADRGHAVSIIGTVETGSGVRDRSGRSIPFPERDEVARVLSSSRPPNPVGPVVGRLRRWPPGTNREFDLAGRSELVADASKEPFALSLIVGGLDTRRR